MWQDIWAIAGYRTSPPARDDEAFIPDAPNHFYAWFEARNNMAARKTIPPPSNQVLCLTTADVRRALFRVDPWRLASIRAGLNSIS